MIRPEPLTLEFNGIRLEPLALHHADGLRAAASDGELWNLRITSVPEPHETEAYIRTALETDNRLAFAVVDASSDTVIGTTSYHDIMPNIDRVEIGYTWYAKSRQRSHVNTSCKLLLLSHAFDTLGCFVVGLRTDNFNYASQAAIEKLGAKKDGVIRHRHLQHPARRVAGDQIAAALPPEPAYRLGPRHADRLLLHAA
jgi:RimJ/RimL family protein N-acetyltransferase